MNIKKLIKTYGETEFRSSGLIEYSGNPLIESLNPIIPWMDTVKQIMSFPQFDEAERQMPTELRIAKLTLFREYFQPLSYHRPLVDKISNMIRFGYYKRNPLDAHVIAQRRLAIENYKRGIPSSWDNLHISAAGIHLVGISGIGKTQLTQRILNLFPKVRVITSYRGKQLAIVQVPWLFIETPHDGSRKTICTKILQSLDGLLGTNYYDHYVGSDLTRVSVDALIIAVASVLRQHEVGILVIDETQHLKDAKLEQSKLALNFFVELVNTLGIPLMLIGTFKAERILTQEFRAARRGATDGDLWWNAMRANNDWQLYASGLFDYQIIKHPVAFDPDFSHTLYDMCQGIPALGTSMFLCAQYRALTISEETGQPETLTKDLMWSVYEDDFRSLHQVLRALRDPDPKNLMAFEDAYSELIKSKRGLYLVDTEDRKPILIKSSDSDILAISKLRDNSVLPAPTIPKSNSADGSYSAHRLEGSLYNALHEVASVPAPSRTNAEMRREHFLEIHTVLKDRRYVRDPQEFMDEQG